MPPIPLPIFREIDVRVDQHSYQLRHFRISFEFREQNRRFEQVNQIVNVADAKVLGGSGEKCGIRYGPLVRKSIQINWIDRCVGILQIALDSLVQRIQERSIAEQILEPGGRFLRNDTRAIQIEITQLLDYGWHVVLVVRRDFHQFREKRPHAEVQIVQ